MPSNFINPDVINTGQQQQILGSLVSLGSFLIKTKYAVDRVHGVIDHLSDEIKDILGEVEGLVDKISETYQENLDITIDKLDDFTRNKIMEIEEAAENIIDAAEDALQNTIEVAFNNIRATIAELEESLENIIIVAGETFAYVIDRATYNIILIVAIVALAVGLIAFPWVLLSTGLPGGLANILIFVFMGLFLAFFGALIIPRFRGVLIRYTGVGLKARIENVKQISGPRILFNSPKVIDLETTESIDVVGMNLLERDKTLSVQIAGKDVPIQANTSTLIVLDVSQLDIDGKSGPYNLVLFYDGEQAIRTVVEIHKPLPPPNLYVSQFDVLRRNFNKNTEVEATFTITNGSETPITETIWVEWLPEGSGSGKPSKKQTIDGLGVGKSQQLRDKHKYTNVGKFTSKVIVDPDYKIEETDENDNFRFFPPKIVVKEPPKPEAPGIWLYTDDLDSRYNKVGGQHAFVEKTEKETKWLFVENKDYHDTISAIKVSGNKEAIVYEHPNFKGRSLYVFKHIREHDLKRTGFNNNISSIELYNKGQISGITICEHKGYSGKTSFLLSGRNYMFSDLAKTGLVRQIQFSYFSSISSLILHNINRVTIYSGINLKGSKRVITGNISDLNSIGWNDKIRSIKFG